MDFTRSEVRRAGQPVTLAARELDLIRYLVQHRDRVVPREEIMGQGGTVATLFRERSMSTSGGCAESSTIRTVRNTFTVRGQGYRFTA